MFSSRSFGVSDPKLLLYFNPFYFILIHFELISVSGVRKRSSFTLLHVSIRFSQEHLLETIFSSLSTLSSLVKY